MLVAAGYVRTPSPDTITPLASAELYDPTTGTWSATGSLANARSGHTATLLNNGLVLVAGGSNWTWPSGSGGPISSAELYNPTTGSWSATASMTTTRSAHTATLLTNGQVLAAGAGTCPPACFSSELYTQ